jgi:acyl-CoA thioesterase-1
MLWFFRKSLICGSDSDTVAAVVMKKGKTMGPADSKTYLEPVCDILRKTWPGNRLVNVVCHGHSVPAGYFATPMVDTFNAYPHLLHAGLKARFPFAVLNVIVTAIGGENSEGGAARFEAQVLTHRPDVLTLDYGLNDRGIGLERAGKAWRGMIESALKAGVKVVLMTPTPDRTQLPDAADVARQPLLAHAAAIRDLAGEYGVGLVDSLAEFDVASAGGSLLDYLSWSNHPNRAGHELVTRALLRWFPASAFPAA